jgi:hypothetical protein
MSICRAFSIRDYLHKMLSAARAEYRQRLTGFRETNLGTVAETAIWPSRPVITLPAFKPSSTSALANL